MDINKLMAQAKQLEKNLEKANEQLNAMQFEASASNGLLKVVVNGEYKIINIDINPSILNKEDKDMIQDLIMIATNEAIDKVNNAKKEKFGAMSQGLKF